MSTELATSLDAFHPCTRQWFLDVFDGPTQVQAAAWPAIMAGESTLMLAPTGSGKTLAAFLAAIDRIMFQQVDHVSDGVRVLYISPLKALGVDVDRNLRVPVAGLHSAADRVGERHLVPRIGIRSGDTPQSERLRINRHPPEILITTPESLYLLLTSQASSILTSVQTVIVDEIHAIAGTKRGTHLFVSLERLERLRRSADPNCQRLQRIGLSATQRPLNEIAGLLGGAEASVPGNSSDGESTITPRPVRIIDTSEPKQFELTVEIPVEDMARLAAPIAAPLESATSRPPIPSIWPAIHPRLLELIREHHSTMIFVNSRRLAERMAAAINELAEEEVALAHHGSIAKDIRANIEDRLKSGTLPAIVATSSLELGIDMGAVDLVIQIEAPPTIASAIQRIGRAGHRFGEPSTGHIFPKYRGDLLACAAATGAMQEGWVEETHYPRNPLDVLAQQIVAVVSHESIGTDELFDLMRQAAPFHELPRSAFDGVLDLLAGRYPSDEFSELRPRINWNRIDKTVSARKGAHRLSILNAGTIPDRGLYGVFLVGDDGQTSSRVGELDEEMVFETRTGDVFLLGASGWRVVEITRDRVLVIPAPGEPGRMPFWRGEGPGRPLEFGRAIGKLARELIHQKSAAAIKRLIRHHGLDDSAAQNLLDYLRDQAEVTGELPSDKTLIVESFLDEVGDWRIVVLSPFGSRVHAPWAMAVAARLRAECAGEVDSMWTDDGIVFRVPESEKPPPLDLFFPKSDEIENQVIAEVGTTALFAARFRENAARSLLIPRNYPGRRTPLWLQRKKSSDLLAVATRFRNFPVLLETYRECLRDVFDLNGLTALLKDVEQRTICVKSVVSSTPSPFASSVLFNFMGNYIYDGDVPLAERRAQALALDHTQLRELLGTADYRELFDVDVLDALAAELLRLYDWKVTHIDGLHDLLMRIGDLTFDELAQRCEAADVESGVVRGWVDQLLAARRIIEARIVGETRLAAAEDTARLRDALGIIPPPGMPDAFLQSVADPLIDLVSRFARCHVPFTVEDVASRFGLETTPIVTALTQLAAQDRVVSGEFLPTGHGQEWCDSGVFKTLKRRSLAKLRKQIEPVDPQVLARFLPDWHNISKPARGLDGLLDVIEQLQGAPLPATVIENEILPCRVEGFRPSQLDELCLSGEVVWRGYDSLGEHDGRIALYLTDNAALLAPTADPIDEPDAERIRDILQQRGALLFEQLATAVGGFRNDLLETLWRMVWAGEITNDTLIPLRSRANGGAKARTHRSRPAGRAFRSRRSVQLPGSEGRWTLFTDPAAPMPTVTERQAAISAQLIERYGVLTREMLAREQIVGGFSGVYPVLKAMEESGRIRRGYFVADLGAAQFASPGADDRLRAARKTSGDNPAVLVLAATDPANAYGNVLSWPETSGSSRPQRTSGAKVILCGGKLIGYLSRTQQHLMTFLPDEDPDRRDAIDELVRAVTGLAKPGASLLLTKINGESPSTCDIEEQLRTAGFTRTSRGYLHTGRAK
jgi:ATP-dependent Lhr-like helicase